MEKLPEAPNRKRGDACAKKKPSRQKKEACPLFSNDQRSDNA